MEICVERFDGEKYTIEVGVDDTTADIRRKVASAAELCEDGFDMSFGGKLLAEGDYVTQLSAGDTVVLTKKTKSRNDDAIAALRDLGERELTPERFKGLEDPKLIHLFLQAEVVTEIPNQFLARSKVRGTFKELDLSGVSGVTKIRESFLQGYWPLHTADLSGWSNVTHIESFFLSNCTGLRTLDLSGWNNVTRVDESFLSNCSSLTTLDISWWNNVMRVGDYFLYYCISLTALHVSGWHNVTRVDDYFLSNCSALTTLDISWWNNVTQIGRNFLSNCIALRTLNLSGWRNVTRVGDDFLSNCSSLTPLGISRWNNVTQIGKNFLSNCSALQTLDLSGWRNVQHIGQGFLEGCKIPKCSINVTGSSSVVPEYVKSRSGSNVHGSNLMGDTNDISHAAEVVKEDTKCKCVCM